MKRPRANLPWLALSFVAFGVILRSAEPLPPASEVTEAMVQRARWVAGQTNGPACRYTMRSELNELNADGHLRKATVKFYDVEQIAGIPYTELTGIQGRDLSEEQLARENEKDHQFRRQFTHADQTVSEGPDHGWLTEELLGRYTFQTLKRETLQGRPTLKLSYRANPHEEKSLRDRVLNRLTGHIWVDETEHEVALLDIELQEPISVGILGILGSLDRFVLRLERLRLSSGTWVNLRQTCHINGRKLFAPVRYQAVEETRNHVGDHPEEGLAATRDVPSVR